VIAWLMILRGMSVKNEDTVSGGATRTPPTKTKSYSGLCVSAPPPSEKILVENIFKQLLFFNLVWVFTTPLIQIFYTVTKKKKTSHHKKKKKRYLRFLF
ncbi:hypothetical protein, partial [Enterobacter mori]